MSSTVTKASCPESHNVLVALQPMRHAYPDSRLTLVDHLSRQLTRGTGSATVMRSPVKVWPHGPMDSVPATGPIAFTLILWVPPDNLLTCWVLRPICDHTEMCIHAHKHGRTVRRGAEAHTACIAAGARVVISAHTAHAFHIARRDLMRVPQCPAPA